MSPNKFRAFDATLVKEPGKTGSLWRIHYSVRVPTLVCDYFKLTPTQGKGSGESFERFPINNGDFIIADRGYSRAPGIAYAASAGAYVLVRVHAYALRFTHTDGRSFDLLEAVSAIEKAQAKLRRRASKNGHKLRPKTLIYAKYVILFTTFPVADFTPEGVLECYRLRWQVELTFKRFKSLAELGHLPKLDDDSAQAWLYGKLFTVLLIEKLIRHAGSISPWGYELQNHLASIRMA